MSTTYLPFGSNSIQVYAYERFNYTIVNPSGTTVASTSNSGGLNPTSLYFSTDGSGNRVFSATDASTTLVPSTNLERFTITATNGAVSSNTVSIGPGRFLDGNGNSLSNNSYTFYKNETITPIQLVAPSFTLKTPTSIPALPPGLSFVRDSSSVFFISGRPTVTVPNSNYQIIGTQQGGSKIVTTKFNMIVSNERLQMNLSGTPIINNMQIGVAITPRVITSIPPDGVNTVRYTFPAFPDGIVVKDISGTTYSNITSFTPKDPSYTMIIDGTPTSNAANYFRIVDPKAAGVVYTVRGSRTSPLPILENTKDITFAFGETVLIDASLSPRFYTGIPIDSSANFFTARTFFSTDASITTIFSPDLADVSLSFLPLLARANLSGTPSIPGTNNFTVRASNTNGKTTDYTASFVVSNDTVSFSSPVGVDLCYNFILSRPLSQAKEGYYPSNIQFTASAASGRPVTLSAPALTGTGITLDSNGILTGIPSTITSLGDLVVTASTGTVSNTKTVKFSILNDVITLGDVSASKFAFIQNIPITPFQIPITSTLSGRNVIDYTDVGLPSGLSISPAGVVSGTCLDSSPTSGNVIVSASTGFASGSNTYSFTIDPDSILFTVPQDNYSYVAGGSAVIPVTGVAYSGITVSNFTFGLPSSYGLSIGSTSGLISGVWNNSIPPNPLLPSSSNFDITAQAGGITGTFPVELTAHPIIERTSFVWASGTLYKYNDASWNQVSNVSNPPNAFDIQFKNSNVDGNFVLFTANNSIWRSTNSVTFAEVVVGDASTNYQRVSSLASKTGSTRWWASGIRLLATGPNPQRANVLKSDDNGLSWTHLSALVDAATSYELVSRNSNSLSGSNPYLDPGVALKYGSGALIAGGASFSSSNVAMLRSSNDGLTWNSVTNGFSKECAYLNLDGSGVWVATGSDKYRSADVTLSFGSLGTANTIKYSTDTGQTWSNAVSGAFSMFGYELVYANGIWMATGVDGFTSPGAYYNLGLKYSTDGSNWSNSSLNTVSLFGNILTPVPTAPLALGSLNYDGSKWNVFAQRQDGSTWVTELYSSPTPTGTWTKTDLTSVFAGGSTSRFVTYTRPNYLRTSQSKTIYIDLAFGSGIGNGPTITSPISTSFLGFQYVPVSIPLTATGVDDKIYFFIAANELPPGLTFNPTTNTITGKPSQIGNFMTRIYAKDTNGVTQLNLSFTIVVPRIVRQQDGAGAYTSLLRQYTDVLGAQNARDNRVLPSQERKLGEFMSPEAPDVITQQFTTTKCKVCKRPDCPSVNERVDAGDVDTKVCDFIDGNTLDATDGIDAGNAEANVCD